MIRLRGVPIGDEEATELARRLREQAGTAAAIADRLDRVLAVGSGLIATSPTDAPACSPCSTSGIRRGLDALQEEL